LEDDTQRMQMSHNAKIKAEQFSISTAIEKIEEIYAENIERYELRRQRGIISKVRSFLDVEFPS